MPLATTWEAHRRNLQDCKATMGSPSSLRLVTIPQQITPNKRPGRALGSVLLSPGHQSSCAPNLKANGANPDPAGQMVQEAYRMKGCAMQDGEGYVLGLRAVVDRSLSRAAVPFRLEGGSSRAESATQLSSCAI